MANSKVVKTTAKLLEFLFAEWPEVKKNKVKDWLKTGAVLVNETSVTQFDHQLNVNDCVSIGKPRRNLQPEGGIQIVFEDKAILVIDKPEGLLSMASENEKDLTAYALLNQYVKQNASKADSQSPHQVLIVHRLDRDTSGLMIFAKTREAQQNLEANWAQNEKYYFAIVEGSPEASEGLLHSHLDESQISRVYSATRSSKTREARTFYRVVKRGSKYSLVELRLETGRRHQIRVQMSDIGCPCVGDKKYGAKSDPARRLGLHSSLLVFKHPSTGLEMRFSSPIPSVLARLV